MATVLDMEDNLKALDLNKEALVAIARTSQEMIELNQQQLSKGKRSDETVMPDYSPTSVRVYGKRPGPFTLYDTGAFYGSFRLDVGSDGFQMLVDDPNGLLSNPKIGPEILGLTDNNQSKYNQQVFLPEFAKNIEIQTGLKV